MDECSDCGNSFIFVKSSSLQISWKWSNTTLLAKIFPKGVLQKRTLIFKGRNHKRYRLAKNRNNLFASKISRQQVSQDLPTHHMPNNHVQDLKYNSHKNLHNSGEQNLLLAEQKVCHLGSKRYKDQLMTSKAIYKDWKMRNMNISITCINYQKAFGSLPYRSIKWIQLVGVNSKIVRFCKLSIEKWNTRLHLKESKK